MSLALEMCGVAKRYVAGSGSCIAFASVLRTVDLSVLPGDVVAVTGSPGSGRSTLLLVAAGLLVPDHGDVRWFGDASRASGARIAMYHFAARDPSPPTPTDARIQLVDDLDSLGRTDASRFARWVERRSAAKDAVVLVTRNRATAHALSPRVYALAGGQLHVDLVAAPRVAETTLRRSAVGRRAVIE